LLSRRIGLRDDIREPIVIHLQDSQPRKQLARGIRLLTQMPIRLHLHSPKRGHDRQSDDQTCANENSASGHVPILGKMSNNSSFVVPLRVCREKYSSGKEFHTERPITWVLLLNQPLAIHRRYVGKMYFRSGESHRSLGVSAWCR